MVEAVLLDKKRILPCATLASGQFGINGAYVGLPVKVGAGGIEALCNVNAAVGQRIRGDPDGAVESTLELVGLIEKPRAVSKSSKASPPITCACSCARCSASPPSARRDAQEDLKDDTNAMTSTQHYLLAAAVFVLGIAGCGGDGDDDDEGSSVSWRLQQLQRVVRILRVESVATFVEVDVADFSFDPDAFNVAADVELSFAISNTGAAAHTFTVYADESYSEPVEGADRARFQI